jgi:hypothetical protein
MAVPIAMFHITVYAMACLYAVGACWQDTYVSIISCDLGSSHGSGQLTGVIVGGLNTLPTSHQSVSCCPVSCEASSLSGWGGGGGGGGDIICLCCLTYMPRVPWKGLHRPAGGAVCVMAHVYAATVIADTHHYVSHGGGSSQGQLLSGGG